MARPPYLQRERAPRNSKHPERTPYYPKTICQSGPSHHYPTAATSAGRPAGEYSNLASAGAPLSRQIRPRRRARYFGESAQSWAAIIPRYSTQSYLRGSRRAAHRYPEKFSQSAPPIIRRDWRPRYSEKTIHGRPQIRPRNPLRVGRPPSRDIRPGRAAFSPENPPRAGAPVSPTNRARLRHLNREKSVRAAPPLFRKTHSEWAPINPRESGELAEAIAQSGPSVIPRNQHAAGEQLSRQI